MCIRDRNGTISSIEEIDYDEDPLWEGEELWVRYLKEDGNESDVDLYDYKWKGWDLKNLDSCGRRQGLWMEDDGYRAVSYTQLDVYKRQLCDSL